MITLLAAFVCIGLVAAFPVLAIPSPDFVGPVIAWLVAMLGLASTVFGAIIIWAQRLIRRLTPRERQGAWIILALGFVLVLTVLGGIAYQRLNQAKQQFQAEHLEIEALPVETTSTQTMPLEIVPIETGRAPHAPTNKTNLSLDLLSTRVSSSTILIPITVLQEVVNEPQWSDRITLIDIREAEEREVGQIDATTTWMRYGDLINGQAKSLPKDKDILVICWTSLRGTEIATWLRMHGFPRTYAIEGGLQGDTESHLTGWIDAGLPWRGHTRWSEVFGTSYSLSLTEAKNLFDNDATVIDVTSFPDYQSGHLPRAISLPFETAPTTDIERVIANVPPASHLLIYCNGYVNCFYAKVLGIRLERQGHTFTEPFNDVNEEWKKRGYPMEKS